MHSWFVILMTLMIALILALLPMPDAAIWFRPAWVLLVLIYWTMSTPHRVNVGVAFAMGILLDLMTGTLLGEHALALTVVIYLVSRMHMRLRMYPMMQQGLCVLFFVLSYQFIIYCTQGFIGNLPPSHLYWLSAITSTVLWPWLFVLMRDFRRWFNVA